MMDVKPDTIQTIHSFIMKRKSTAAKLLPIYSLFVVEGFYIPHVRHSNGRHSLLDHLGNDLETPGVVVLNDLDQLAETFDNYMPDVESAVEALEQHDASTDAVDSSDLPKVIVQTEEMIDETRTDVTKQELTNPIMQAMMENKAESQSHTAVESMKGGSTIARPNMMSDIQRKVSYSQRNNSTTTDRDAAVSASLYMNPATEKIASNLIVTWEPAVAEIIDRLARVSNPARPFLVGIVGIPGSGKSTSAEIVVELLGSERAMVMPMDGFHLELSRLADAPNAKDLIYRRGAPDTFDPYSLRNTLHDIAYGDQDIVRIPGFDHAVGDPLPDQHTFVRGKSEIVLVEGLYLLHDDHGWETIQSVFDWTIYIDANVDDCIERLKIRNKCIPGYSPEEIEARCDIVDRKNAELARDGARKYASQIVTSGAS